jgi:hypothetical protein
MAPASSNGVGSFEGKSGRRHRPTRIRDQDCDGAYMPAPIADLSEYRY